MGLRRRHHTYHLVDASTLDADVLGELDNYVIIGGWAGADIVRLDALDYNREAAFIGASDIPTSETSGAEDAKDLFQIGFHWQRGDDEVAYWMPQGITGSADTTWSGDPTLIDATDDGRS